MPKRVTDYRPTLLERLTDPGEAALYLEAALEDSKEMFLTALRDVAESRQMSSVAKEAGVAREALYRMLSESGNPTFASLSAILDAVGVRLKVTLKDEGVQPITPMPHPDSVSYNQRLARADVQAKQTNAALIGSLTQENQQISTQPIYVSGAACRKPPTMEIASAMSGWSLSDLSRQINEHAR